MRMRCSTTSLASSATTSVSTVLSALAAQAVDVVRASFAPRSVYCLHAVTLRRSRLPISQDVQTFFCRLAWTSHDPLLDLRPWLLRVVSSLRHILAATLPERGSLRSDCRSQSSLHGLLARMLSAFLSLACCSVCSFRLLLALLFSCLQLAGCRR